MTLSSAMHLAHLVMSFYDQALHLMLTSIVFKDEHSRCFMDADIRAKHAELTDLEDVQSMPQGLIAGCCLIHAQETPPYFWLTPASAGQIFCWRMFNSLRALYSSVGETVRDAQSIQQPQAATT